VRTLRIGITGPIGCGKSTVAGMLAEHGAVVVDADRVARDVYTDPAIAARVVDRFGPHVRLADGSIDRTALAAIVFEDAAALRDLEGIVHPAVRPRILAAIAVADAAGAPAAVVEAIKLVEGGLAELCDEVWLVTCEPAAQRERLRERGMSAEDADRRIGVQHDLVETVAPVATRRIDTSGSTAATRAAVDEAWGALTR
jgi:dephospho-CoA kinase